MDFTRTFTIDGVTCKVTGKYNNVRQCSDDGSTSDVVSMMDWCRCEVDLPDADDRIQFEAEAIGMATELMKWDLL